MSRSAAEYDVIIAGGGPAGSSAAIHLARSGARVLLAEQKRFPRGKLCGEFISPECVDHFERLGVRDRIFASGAERLSRTVFYARSGKSVAVPSSWFGTDALGLSRAEMDLALLDRARAAGAEVREGTQVNQLLKSAKKVYGVQLKTDSSLGEANARTIIDATGRSRSLARRLNGTKPSIRTRRPSLVAFKAHLREATVAPGACEIYFYPGGYGGLSSIENGLSNLCFIAAAKDVRACDSDAATVMRQVVMKNARASAVLARAVAASDWFAVSLEHFGRQEPSPASGLLTVGDAAAFIDPFTGSGMLMALEGGELVATTLSDHLEKLGDERAFKDLAEDYRSAYQKQFASRLRVCSLLRKAAFVPALASLAIVFFGGSDRLRRMLARATRTSK